MLACLPAQFQVHDIVRDGRRQPVRERLVFELGLAVLMGLGGHRISISQVLVGGKGGGYPNGFLILMGL